jgi:branched-chain amino acid transport system substrate-binding protein
MKLFKLAIAILMILTLAGCSGQITGGSVQEEPIKIGVVAPMTGSLAYFGEWMLNGYQMAADEINAEGGVNGRQIELIVEDDVCSPQPAITAFNKLHDFDKVDAFVGAYCGSPIFVAAEFSKANEKIVISPNTNFGKLSDFFFTTDTELRKEAGFLAEYLAKKNITKVGVLYLNNDWGLAHKEHFTKRFTELGGELTGVESFEFSTTDYRTMIAKVTADKPQAIFVIYSNPALAINQIRELGFDGLLVGQRGVENPTLIQVSGKNADGMIFSASGDVQEGSLIKSQLEFKEKYEARFKTKISHTSANAYDSVQMIAKAMEECGSSDASCMKESILKQDFDGASGHVKINPELNGVDRNIVMKAVKDGQFVLLED